MSIKLSIITTNYNKSEYILEMLNSVKMAIEYYGKINKIEHVVVDDSSTDNSLKIIKSFSKDVNYKLKIVENKENVGLGGSRNIGMTHSSGEYIWHTDSDDMITPESIKFIMRDIKSNKTLYKYEWEKFPKKDLKSRWHLENGHKLKHFYGVAHVPWTSIWNKKEFLRLGGIFLPNNGDLGAMIAISKLNIERDIQFSPNVILLYRTVENSMSRNKEKSYFVKHYNQLFENLMYVNNNIHQKAKKYFQSQTYHAGTDYIIYSKILNIDYKNNYEKLKKINGRHRAYMLLKYVPRFILKLIKKNKHIIN